MPSEAEDFHYVPLCLASGPQVQVEAVIFGSLSNIPRRIIPDHFEWGPAPRLVPLWCLSMRPPLEEMGKDPLRACPLLHPNLLGPHASPQLWIDGTSITHPGIVITEARDCNTRDYRLPVATTRPDQPKQACQSPSPARQVSPDSRFWH